MVAHYWTIQRRGQKIEHRDSSPCSCGEEEENCAADQALKMWERGPGIQGPRLKGEPTRKRTRFRLRYVHIRGSPTRSGKGEGGSSR